jgi:hypothetical protein
MDPVLQENAQKWIDRGRKYHSSQDPYGAYFAYFIALLIIARDHENSSGRSSRSDSDQIRKLFEARSPEILNALRNPSLAQVTTELANRLIGTSQGLEQSIVYIRPGSLDESDSQRVRVESMNDLAAWWRHGMPSSEERGMARNLFYFLWQVRNNLFHGEKGYGHRDRLSQDAKLLDRSCRLLDAVCHAMV